MNELKMLEWVKQITECTDDGKLNELCEEVWQDGYDEGWEENETECSSEPLPWHELD